MSNGPSTNGQATVVTKDANLRQIGMSGLDHHAGIVTENEFNPKLSGRDAIETWKEMRDNEPVVGAVLFGVDMLMRQAKWRAEPFSQEDRDVEDAEFLQSNMEDMSHTFQDAISEINSKLVFGWSYSEIVYKKRRGPDQKDPRFRSKYDDGKVGWRKFLTIAQESIDRWEFDESDGGIAGLWQRPAPTYVERLIPIEKALLFRTTIYKNNPEGRSPLRTSYRPYYYKKRIEEIEGVGIERDLAGLPFAYVPPEILSASATDDEKAILAQIREIVQNVRRDKQEGIIFPRIFDDNGHQLYEFSLLSSGGSRQFDTSGIIERYVKHIAMTMLADFILLGHEATGSFALSSDKTSLFSVALGAWMDMDAGVFNNYAVPRLFRLNGRPTDRLPKIVHGDIEQADLGKISSYIASLVAAGMPLFPDPTLERWLRDAANMPPVDPNATPQLPQPTAKPVNVVAEPEAATQPPQGANAGRGVNQ